MTSSSPLRTPLATARGHGSAKHGAGHWIKQRMTAVALIPLTVWFMVSILTTLLGADHYSVAEWVGNPFVAISLIALVLVIGLHARLGLQVIVEDYVHKKCVQTAILVGIKLSYIALTLLGVFAVASLHFKGLPV